MNASPNATASSVPPHMVGVRFVLTLVGALGLIGFAIYDIVTSPGAHVQAPLSLALLALASVALLFGRRQGSARLVVASHVLNGVAVGLFVGMLLG